MFLVRSVELLGRCRPQLHRRRREQLVEAACEELDDQVDDEEDAEEAETAEIEER